jgi:hypothetical protein
MDDVSLSNYIAGISRDPVEMGRLERSLSDVLSVQAGTPIWFSEYTFQKLWCKHGDINYSHYRHMPAILLKGFAARGRKPSLLELWWVDKASSEIAGFFVVLKATRRGEVYVKTFHRVSIKEARRLLKRAVEEKRLLREQPGAAALIQAGTDHLKSKKKVA